VRKRNVVLLVSISLLLNTLFVHAAKRMLTVRIWVLQGTIEESAPSRIHAQILPISTTAEFEKLRALIGGPEDDFKAAVIETLLNLENLRTLTDLFVYKESRREDLSFQGKVMLGRNLAYRVDLLHKVLSSSQLALFLKLSKTKEGIIRAEKDDRTMLRNAYHATRDEEKMEQIASQEIEITIGDPVVYYVPKTDQPYFVVISVTADEKESSPSSSPKLRPPSMPNLVPAPRAIERVLPSYPAELKRRYIRGEVGLRIAIDEKGDVRFVQVVTPLHPYLDYVASQALWRWKFEPVVLKGKPVPAAFDYQFVFDPRTYAEEMTVIEEKQAALSAADREELEKVLNGCAEYCRKLYDAALFYVCQENINEITHSLVSADRLAELPLRGRDFSFQVNESTDGQMSGWLVDNPQIIERRRAARLNYECDYQLVRRYGDIEERRIVLKTNGRKINNRVELLEEQRYSSLTPIVSVLSILDEEHQLLFHFRILKEDKEFGKNSIVIEAVPKLGDADGIWMAKIWVEKEYNRILRCEIEGIPLDGYEDILGEAVLLNIRPFFLRTYEYRIENNHVLLPKRTEVRVEYPSVVRNRRETKSRIDLEYKDFKFFVVETEGAIK